MTKISKKFRHLALLPLYALFFFIGAVTVQAATYYVATTGKDAQTCVTAQTITTPYRTIAAGVECLNPGDTLYIRSGTWTEQINMTGKSGTAGNYITIAAYPGETVTIRTTGNTPPTAPVASLGFVIYDGFVFDGVNTSDNNLAAINFNSGEHDLIYQNNEIKNFKGHGFYVQGNNITLRNNTIHDQVSVCQCPGERWYGLYFHHGSNLLFEGNNVYDNPGGGIQAYPGPITNLIIRNNKIHDNNTLLSSPIGGIVILEVSGTPITGVQVYNNLIYNNGSAPTHGDSPGIRVSHLVDGTKIWNNTIYGNDGWGIKIEASTATNTVVQNNIVYQNTMGAVIDVGTGTILSNNLTSNPNFVNASAFDFNLQGSSPAVDAGVPLSNVKTDFKNTPRPQGVTHDIGAFERGTGSDDTPPSPPQSLRIN